MKNYELTSLGLIFGEPIIWLRLLSTSLPRSKNRIAVHLRARAGLSPSHRPGFIAWRDETWDRFAAKLVGFDKA